MEYQNGSDTPLEQIVGRFLQNLKDHPSFDDWLVARVETTIREGNLTSLDAVKSILGSFETSNQ